MCNLLNLRQDKVRLFRFSHSGLLYRCYRTHPPLILMPLPSKTKLKVMKKVQDIKEKIKVKQKETRKD